jgi:hypothetical protein
MGTIFLSQKANEETTKEKNCQLHYMKAQTFYAIQITINEIQKQKGKLKLM